MKYRARVAYYVSYYELEELTLASRPVDDAGFHAGIFLIFSARRPFFSFSPFSYLGAPSLIFKRGREKLRKPENYFPEQHFWTDPGEHRNDLLP